jgi:hypothetical protein
VVAVQSLSFSGVGGLSFSSFIREFQMSEYEQQEQESQQFPLFENEYEPEDPYYDWDEENEQDHTESDNYEQHEWEENYDEEIDF